MRAPSAANRKEEELRQDDDEHQIDRVAAREEGLQHLKRPADLNADQTAD